MLKKLTAQAMENRGNMSKEEVIEILGKLDVDSDNTEERERKKQAKAKKPAILSREDMKDFHNVLIKTYKKKK